MKIIISPAKKMAEDFEGFEVKRLPRHLNQARRLLSVMQKMDDSALKKLWKCNDKLAKMNIQRVRAMDLEGRLTPAILAYDGLQYSHMAPSVFTDAALSYVEEHLLILSGFYGALSPLDGVTPYRLEMGAKLCVDGAKNLYEFWKDALYRDAMDADRTILNLASQEYARAVIPYLKPGDRFITPRFLFETEGGLKTKATFAKAARGEMLRFLAENQIRKLGEIKNFCALNFVFEANLSDENNICFVHRPPSPRREDF